MLQIVLGVAAAAALLTFAPGASRAAVEQPKYRVLETVDGVEVREYPARIVAETVADGSEQSARNEGFRRIAGYIFGGNKARASVAMTSPVAQSAASEKIAMTSPVAQGPAGDGWRIQFFMPAKYGMADLPVPNDPKVTLRRLPPERYAVIRFSGLAGERAVAARRDRILAVAKARGWRLGEGVDTWFYDPPWTPPPMRRNEVAIRLAGA